ncbi:MAG: caspase family protein [Candidatus Hatepunaea meridiana]|nr:caspase family protein [Candidatus Hatepunaea meridiana]
MKHTLFILLLTAVTTLIAAEPPSEPILRIETGMHTAMIKRIGIDAQERYIVTGSGDKTVRVWDASTGRLLRTIRVPIGEGNEGKLYCVAVSPDGRTIACGGWTGWNWDKKHSIYLFDRSRGRMIERITGLPKVISHLTFSPDGRYLAVTLGGSNGVSVYSTRDWSLKLKDTDYGADSYGADFDRDNRLVTSCWDGYIRLYDIGDIHTTDKNVYPTRKVKAPGGSQPYQVSFSPDGSKIAVGYHDSRQVDVLNGKLSHLYSPDISGVNNGNLFSVTWSADGRKLYAGGMWSVGGNRPIRIWSDGGRGSYQDLNGPDNTILHLLPFGDGVAFGSADPAFGTLNRSGEQTMFKGSAIADYRDNHSGFLTSRDGSEVQFGFKVWGKRPARFSVTDRSLILNPTEVSLSKPITSSSQIKVENWKNEYDPTLHGAPIKLKKHEMSRSLAIAPNGDKFLLGTEWYLRCNDRNGKEKWNVDVPGTVWSVNVSGDGSVGVAAFADGTICWYRMADGEHLLSFFPHNDEKRWVMWTPSGYYDCSSGGEDLIGWHVNNGKDNAADFYPASRFRSTYYRPDVVVRMLDVLDESEAIRLANAERGHEQRQQVEMTTLLPPVIEILSPYDGQQVSSNEVTVRYSIRSASGEPVTAIRAFVDGRPVSQDRGMKRVQKNTESDGSISVTIPSRNCEISLIADNRYTSSVASIVRLVWKGKTEEFVIKPKLYILSIGVSSYEDPELKLDFAAKDAGDFAEVMRQQKGLLYRDVTVTLLTDDGASKDDILDGLEWIERETTSKDIAMIFLAGHGINDPNGNFYYLPVEANLEKPRRTMLPVSEIKLTISNLAGKALLFFDACHSGNVMGKRRGVVQADVNAVVNELASAETGAVVFASSTGKQYSMENENWKNGAFTKALVEGLSGKADYTGKGSISVNMLDLYLSERVKELTGGRQTPTTAKPQTIQDFPVAIVK